MDIRKLQRAIVDGLEDVKAQDILVFNTEHLSPLFERVIIASGTSNRQTKALAASVRDAVRASGEPIMSVEGEDNGEWIIVDCGAAVAHIMQPAIRDYYRLEEIWGGKPVKIKLGGGAAKGLVKASEPEDEAPVGKKKPVAKPAPAQKAPAKKAAPAKKTATAARKKATAQRQLDRQPAAETIVVKKPAAKKVAAKQVAARKPAAKKAAARPVAAKKAPARKTAARG
ncbi:MAG: ribosome silencing factor [Burkholderiaceae bacterium]|nr:ribosome silencing factor [Burkholderiaceae bacterium]